MSLQDDTLDDPMLQPNASVDDAERPSKVARIADAPDAASAAPAASADSTVPASATPAEESKEAIDVESESTPTKPHGISNAAAYHVSTTTNITSASFEYVDPVDDNFVCKLCDKPLYRPVQHKLCGNLLCAACVAQPNTLCPYKPDCGVAVKARDTFPAPRPFLALVDNLAVRCPTCAATMPRSAYEAHWLNECPRPCPFAADGCNISLPRASLNAHIDACVYAPVLCDASEYGCTWAGRRDALEAHIGTCILSAALPMLHRMAREHNEALARAHQQIAALRVALETREGQLRSWQTRAMGTHEREPWPVGTLIDALDTEQSWLLARITKVDTIKRMYGITYLDWDSSWDEILPFTSNRLAPGGTHTSGAEVDKHVRKALAVQAAAAASKHAAQASGAAAPATPSKPTAAAVASSSASAATTVDLTGTTSTRKVTKRKA